MTKKKRKWGLILAPIAVIAICVSMIAGSTLALFTNESKVNVAVTSAKVEVTATVDNLRTYSGEWNGEEYESVLQEGTAFANGGFAAIYGNNISLNAISPFDKVSFDLTVTNKSTIDVKFRTVIKNVTGEDNALFEALDITVDDSSLVYDEESGYVNSWAVMKKADGENYPTEKYTVVIALSDAGNELQGNELSFDYCVEAVQANAYVADPTVDENTVAIYTASDLRNFSASVNAGNTYKGKTVKLMNDIDLEGVPFESIGGGIYATQNDSLTGVPDASFMGTFEGNNKTIRNLTVEAKNEHGVATDGKIKGTQYAGLFGHLAGRVQNLNIVKANIKSSHYAGAIAGAVLSSVGDISLEGNTVWIKNCTVDDSVIESAPELIGDEYDNGDKVGGIVGYLANYSDSNKRGYTVSDNTVKNTTIKAYRDIGGIIGYGYLWYGTNPNTISANKVENVTLIQDLQNGYKTVAEVIGTIGQIIGHEMSNGAEPDGYSHDFGACENVSVKTIANSVKQAEDVVELVKEQNAKLLANETLQFKNSNIALVLAEGDYEVTPDNAQFVLDLIGDNSSIMLTSGEYGTLTLGSSMASTYDRKPIDYYSHHRLTRKVNNLVINSAENVVIEGFRLGSTLNNNSDVAAENKITNPIIGDKSMFYARYYVDGLTINGVTLENGIVMTSEGWDTVELSDITITGCKTTDNENHLSSAAGVVSNNRLVDIRKATNVVIEDCEVINRYQGIYLQGVKNATVKGCTFKYNYNTLQEGHNLHNAIAFQDYSTAYCSGELKVVDNTFTNIKERIIRFGNIYDANIEICGNKIEGCGDEDGSLCKIQNKADGVTFNLSDNGDNFRIDINGSEETIK